MSPFIDSSGSDVLQEGTCRHYSKEFNQLHPHPHPVISPAAVLLLGGLGGGSRWQAKGLRGRGSGRALERSGHCNHTARSVFLGVGRAAHYWAMGHSEVTSCISGWAHVNCLLGWDANHYRLPCFSYRLMSHTNSNRDAGMLILEVFSPLTPLREYFVCHKRQARWGKWPHSLTHLPLGTLSDIRS